MSFTLREARFDVAVVAGPGLEVWPSAGVRELTTACAEMGLKTGIFGGEGLEVRGVIPLPETGGIVVAQDVQGRIHRIRARSIVRFSAPTGMPDPFPGWRSPGLVPIATAARLRRETHVRWDPATVILGTGNRALRFGSELLESGVGEVYCLESYAEWGAKRFSGWEVERRRFEMAGGRIIEGRPLSLHPKAPLIWEFRIQDVQGVRLIQVSRVVGAGPYRPLPEVREYPPGSFLFEIEQCAGAQKEDDVEGWAMEVERSRALAGKIVRSLVSDLGALGPEDRERFEQRVKRAKGRLKRYLRHFEESFTPAYQGKWMAGPESRKLRTFGGAPAREQLTRPVASIECIEEIPCDVCARACPEGAIEIGRVPRPEGPVLLESKCSGCGICLTACPSGATLLIQERENRSTSTLTLPWRGLKPWKAGDSATLLNRRGDALGSGRVTKVSEAPEGMPGLVAGARRVQWVELEVPAHLTWDARGLRRGRASQAAAEDEVYLENVARSEFREDKIEVTFNGERRLVRDGIPISAALFEIGYARPEDVLYCKDGSCGLCNVSVDGVKKLACRSRTHRGMSIRLDASTQPPLLPTEQATPALCSCTGTSRESVVERVQQGNLLSPEAVLSVCKVGQGKCHGQLCLEPFRWTLLDLGLDAEQWIDWRFPWSEWKLTSN